MKFPLFLSAFALTFIQPILATTLDYLPAIPLVGDLIAEYEKLNDACKNGGPSVYVGVHYEGIEEPITFEYDECYPYKIDGHFAKQAVFCRVAYCFDTISESEGECGGLSLPPVTVPVGPPETLVNVGHFANAVGDGAICYKDLKIAL
ncbi:hypothetical protein VKT23_017843 [Stygiomarasmius scandens]|uniref:Uncharacterized protein n=1 Tax=Marasmiellus scandens TaxID=2682957 RepID=A0ABR1ISL7_9AGAR